MLRNITTAQKHVHNFYKSDMLVQTNQIKYDCFFLHDRENIKKLFCQDLRHAFLDFILFFKIAVEKFI